MIQKLPTWDKLESHALCYYEPHKGYIYSLCLHFEFDKC